MEITSEKLHPSLSQALRKIGNIKPNLVEPVSASLSVLTRRMSQTVWPEVAWCFSSLTGNGFPVEFAFSAMDNAVRYTVDIGGPEMVTTAHLPFAQSLLAELGSPMMPFWLYEQMMAMQSRGQLFYGAWLSGRHDDGGARYKLYIEVPDGVDPVTGTYFERAHLLSDQATPLCMIGYEPLSDRLEFYYRARQLAPHHLGQLLSHIALADQAEPLTALIRTMSLNRWRDVLPGKPGGFSYSVSLKNEPAVFAYFTFARALCGSDRHIRNHVLSQAEANDWSLDLYRTLSAPLSEQQGWQTGHGLVSFVAAPKTAPFIHIGLNPHGTA